MKTFSIKRGDTWRQSFENEDDDGKPIVLTGSSAWFQLREKGSDRVLLDSSEVEGMLRIDNSTVYLEVHAELMATLPIGKHLFDIETTYPDGTVLTSETYALKVIKDVTRTL